VSGTVAAVLENNVPVGLWLAGLLVVFGVGSLVSTLVKVLTGREGR
jgi:hypothetical protein